MLEWLVDAGQLRAGSTTPPQHPRIALLSPIPARLRRRRMPMPHTLETRHRAFIPRQAPGRLSPDGSVAVPRILSVMAGAALGSWGLRRGGPAGVFTALVGIGLLARGIAGPGLLVTPLASNRSRRWAIAGREVRPGEARGDARYNAREAAVDEAVEESFPASDPPAWTSTGIGRVAARPEASVVGAGVSPEPESLPGGTKSPLPRYWPAEPETH
jgi:hypothetical protein